MVFEFVSTSKISFAGSGNRGHGFLQGKPGRRPANLWLSRPSGMTRSIRLRHVRFFKNLDGVKAHMEKHAALLRPRFELVLRTLEENLKGTGAGTWTEPKGGYFITFEAVEGCASRIVELAKEGRGCSHSRGISVPLWKGSEGCRPPDCSVLSHAGGAGSGRAGLCRLREAGDSGEASG